jgi:Domain of unknown function (DU1801)
MATSAVDEFLASLKHPHLAGIEQLRAMILGMNKKISEEIKWNAPSFKLVDHFATFRVSPPKNIQLILHTGAKAKSNARAFKIDDPDGLLKWPAKDRAVLTLASTAALKTHKASVLRILKQWVAQL